MVFVRRKSTEKASYDIATLMDVTEVKGNVGLEIEVEGNHFRKPAGFENTHKAAKVPNLTYWSYVKDGSLRGEDNAEYVLTKPIPFDEVQSALDILWGMFKTDGTILTDSNRTSVHVHINCQSLFIGRLTSFISAYYCVEEILTEWCGDHRVGNLFCLRAKDAPALVTFIRDFIKSDGKGELNSQIHHYAALNTAALKKFGSLEFRTLRGCSDPKVIVDWVSILERLYNLSEEFDDPSDLCGRFSADGPNYFFDFLLGDKAQTVRGQIGWSEDRLRDSMYEGVRIAQDLCYCRDWAMIKNVSLRPDPFDRKKKTLLNSIETAGIADPWFAENAGQPLSTEEVVGINHILIEMDD